MIDIKDASGKLLMRYDPDHDLIEIQRRGVKTNIDLNQYKRSAMSAVISEFPQSGLSADDELRNIKRSLLMNFVQSGSPIKEDDMTLLFCLALIDDVSTDYLRIKSAMSAAQGGNHGRLTNK